MVVLPSTNYVINRGLKIKTGPLNLSRYVKCNYVSGKLADTIWTTDPHRTYLKNVESEHLIGPFQI
jgi:hypothetical protein